MKYTLDCFIRTNNDGIRNAVKQLIPDIEDDRIWDEEYSFQEYVDDEGINVFSCSVMFYFKDDRDGISNSVKDVTGIINSCEVGSYVREVLSGHDETPRTSCEIEMELRKD